MSVSRKFPEYVILVDPATLLPYKATGGGGAGSSVNLLDNLGNDITAANPLPVSVIGNVAVSSLPAVTVSSLPALPAGANTIGKVDQGTGGASAWLVTGAGGTFPVTGSVTVSGTVTANAGSGVFNIRPAVPAANDYLPVRLTDGASFYTASGGSGGGTVDQGTGGASAWLVTGAGGTFPVTGTVAVSSLPALPTGGNVIGAVTQSGTWNVTVNTALPAGNNNIGDVDVVSLPSLPAGANVIGAVTQSGAWSVGVTGSVTVTGTVTANAGSGTFATAQTNAATADYDLGAGTVTQVMFGLALPKSGGPVAGGTATDPIRVDPTGTTPQPAAQSGTWTVTQSGTWNVGLNAGSNTVGKVDQGTAGASAWLVTGAGGTFPVTGSVTANAGSGVFSVSQTNLATADYDTTGATLTQAMMGLCVPSATGPVAVPGDGSLGLKVQVTGGALSAVQSGTWTVQQGTPPWSVSQSGTWNVGLSTGSNTVGKVDQGTGGASAWLVTGAGGTFPVTGTVAATQSGTWTVQQGTPPWSTHGAVGSGSALTSVNPFVIGVNTGGNARFVTSPPSGRNTDGSTLLSCGLLAYDGSSLYKDLLVDASQNLRVNLRNVAGTEVGTSGAPLSVTSASSATATRSSVASTTSMVTLLASNASRRGATIFNDGTKILFVALGSAPSLSDYTARLMGQEYYEIPYNYTGIITGIWSAANGAARITELT